MTTTIAPADTATTAAPLGDFVPLVVLPDELFARLVAYRRDLAAVAAAEDNGHYVDADQWHALDDDAHDILARIAECAKIDTH